MTNFGINSPEGQERIVGVAVSPGAAASTVLTADGAGGTSWAAGGGGSRPASLTDQIYTVSEEAGANGGTFAVTAVSGTTVTIAGDHAALFAYGLLRIVGSTGNDGIYVIDHATFGVGHTVITIVDNGSPFPDGTADGDVEAPATYTTQIDVEAGSAIEWVSLANAPAWDCNAAAGLGNSGPAFWSLGTLADPRSVFGWYLDMAHVNPALPGFDAGAAVWGTAFNTPDEPFAFDQIPATDSSYVRFDADTTLVNTIQVFDDASSTGVSTIIVHRHIYVVNAAAQTRVPAGS